VSIHVVNTRRISAPRARLALMGALGVIAFIVIFLLIVLLLPVTD
jgi:hypothetical protein